MRLRQLLSFVGMLLVLSTLALAANTTLTDIQVAVQGNATVVTLHANGAFTHTEYRPTEKLMLIDLTGVSAGQFADKSRTLDQSGVNAYHVLTYKGATGADVTRIELAVSPDAALKVSESKNGLELRVADKLTATSAAPAASPVAPKGSAAVSATSASKPSQAPVAAASSTSTPVLVRNVSVVQGEGTTNVEIATNGPITPKATRLSSPPRIVLDFPNAIPMGRNQVVPVQSPDVKEVRFGQFQADPPIVRVVVDMASARPYELVPQGNKITLKLRNSEAHAALKETSQPVIKTETPNAEANSTPKNASPAITPATAPAAPAKAPVKDVAPTRPPVDAQDVVAKADASAVKAASETIAETKTATENKPADFVVVSPTYAPKTEAAAPVAPTRNPKDEADSAARVIATAAKAFPGQPVSNLASAVTAMPSQGGAANGQKRYSGEPISVNLKDVDLKDFFRLIHEISGLNIVLDPNVHGTLTLVLDDVPWDQALDIVLENNGLDRVLEGNVLRIATLDTLRKEADAQRQKNEAEALSVPKVSVTHFLSYARAADVVPVVKKFLSQRGDVIADTRTNSVIVSDIPSVIPEVQRLMTQLDRKTQEVEIEARVIAATRSFARDIGVQLGFGWGNGNGTTVGGAGSAGVSPLTPGYVNPPPYFTVPGVPIPTGTTATATPAAIPLFSNLGVVNPTSGISLMNAVGNYRLDAILTMAESRGLLKILSRPRVVTQNNVQAVVRQGLQIPVVTQAQLGGPPTTTYVQAFLRLTVVPQITIEHTIFMNIDVENTTPDFSRSVQGNPTLITQQATTSVLVSDGGTVVIGGVIQTQNSINIQQVPLLGDLPMLGNLFKHRTVTTSTQELLFFVTPKIIQT
ncbi:MAG TPA: type IV pilus secretin PilQ [Terriglobales bacterium]|nr:type IV pilus secretin PilQ [Terriglobales bacterium]